MASLTLESNEHDLNAADSQNGSVERTAFYLTSGDAPLLAWLHTARQTGHVDHGVVICAPVGFEQLHSQRTLRHLADALARQGIPVLRFDWHGTGDSSGSDADPARRAAWQNNVRDAVAWLRTQLGCQRVSVVGLRMGATLAVEALGEHECDNLVLWAPVTCGKGYMRQMQAIEKMAELRPRPDDAAAGDVEAAGFLVTEQTAEGFLKSNVLRREFTCAQALVVGPADKRLVERFEQLEIPVTSISPPGFVEMMAEPHFSQVPHQAVQEIAGWLSQQIERSPKADLSIALKDLGPGTATVLPHAGETAIREHVWRFGGEFELFGILSEPNDPAPGLPTIVLLNCGAANHVGPGRVNVELSRHLASIGFPTLRIDACGLGDSVLINPLTFYWQDGMPFDASAAIKLMQEQSTTPEPLAEPTGFWSRLQSAAKCVLGRNPSDANLDGSAAVVEDDEKVAAPLGHPPENNLSADLARLARTKRQLAMFLAENDPGLAVMKYHAPRAVKQWLDSSALRLTMIDGGDHTFSRRVPRRKLLSAVGKDLLSRYQTSG
jgi:pimeloyl-ACP methyl ester carboxylesterase